jgi:outer membrane protein OmpA-like peptidoglycan-associated protein
MVEKGIDESRIATKGYGETSPVASNKTAAGRQQNRRVEVIILEDAQNPQ